MLVRLAGSATRLSAGLVCLCLSVVFLASLLGLVPDRKAAILAGRQAAGESLALQCSAAAEEDLKKADVFLRAASERNSTIRSLGLRAPDGRLVVHVGPHEETWIRSDSPRPNWLRLPIDRDGRVLGTLEIRFEPLPGGILGAESPVPFLLFFGVICFGLFTAFLRPVMADSRTPPVDPPPTADEAAKPASADPFQLIEVPNDDAAIRAIQGDISSLERKHAQLRKVLIRLRKSRKVVRRQNHELKALATRDPLTGCFNRRTLFAEFEKHWDASERFDRPLSCMMIDLDHFKSINDQHGHAVGDEVLKGVAETLKKTARRTDFVCRYGGEEFCVVLPQIDLAAAVNAAERFRQALASQPFGGIMVTASFGVSARSLGSKHPQELLEQADKSLIAAKRLRAAIARSASTRRRRSCSSSVPTIRRVARSNASRPRRTPTRRRPSRTRRSPVCSPPSPTAIPRRPSTRSGSRTCASPSAAGFCRRRTSTSSRWAPSSTTSASSASRTMSSSRTTS